MSAQTSLENFRTMLAACPAFRTWAGAADAAAALERIHIVAAPEGQPTRPFCFVYQHVYRLTCEAFNSFSDGGVLAVYFEQDIDEDDLDDPPAYATTFMDSMELIMEGLIVLRSTGGYFEFNSLEMEPDSGPRVTSPKYVHDEGNAISATMFVPWGLGGQWQLR